MHVKAVLFDLDDTLFDHQYSSRSGLEAAQQQHEHLTGKTVDELEQDYIGLLHEVWPLVLTGQITMEESRIQRFQRMFEKYKMPIGRDEGLALSNYYRAAYQENRRSVPGTVPLLESLRARGIKVAVVTNNLLAEQEDKLRFCHLDHLIDFLIVSEQVGIAKPEPAIFKAALDAVGCSAGEVVMVGDSWQSDVLGATRLGIRSVWFNRFGDKCPDPDRAAEITALEPLDQVLGVLLGSIENYPIKD